MATDPRLLESDALEATQSQTEPESSSHPVRAFLQQMGLQTSHFPSVKFVIETSEKDIRVGRTRLSIRLPYQNGIYYESILRITRVLEFSAAGLKGNRKFLEIEWMISEEASLDEDHHPALSFLAGQVECSHCHEIFAPDPEIINQTTVKFSCPSCLLPWSMNVNPLQRPQQNPELLIDLFRRDASKLRALISKWSEGPVNSHDRNFFQYFPFHFEAWSESASMDWLFGDLKGWSSLGNSNLRDFEALIRGFLNAMTLEYFKNHFFGALTSELDKTEVQRKTEIQRKEEAQKRAIREVVPSFSPTAESHPAGKAGFDRETPTDPVIRASKMGQTPLPSNGANQVAWTMPNTAVRSFEKPHVAKPASKGNLLQYAATVLIVLIVGGGLAYLGLNVKVRDSQPELPKMESTASTTPPEIQQEQAQMIETKKDLAKDLVVAAKKPVQPKPVETKIEKAEIPTPVVETATVQEDTKPIVKTPAETKPAKAKKSSEDKSNSTQTEDQKKLRDLAIDSAFRQGMLHLKLQQSKEAISEFKRVISLDPTNVESHRGLGLAYVYEQNFNSAIEALNRYLELSKNAFDKSSVEELIVTLKDRVAAQAQ